MGENKDQAVLKKFKKIPIYVVEEHNDALQFIYSAIGGQRLPLEGTTLLHLDAHPDLLIDRKLKGEDARAGRKLLPLLQIENWIVPAVAAGHIGRVVWLKPPWAKQFSVGDRVIHVGDCPETGFLRVDSKEPYYFSDALYSSRLNNQREFHLTVAELSPLPNDDNIHELKGIINISEPYVLDIDLDFFSTGNPFLFLYEHIGLYDRLLPIFDFKTPANANSDSIEKVLELRKLELDVLEKLFLYLEEKGSLEGYNGEKSDLFNKVSDLADIVISECKRLGEKPDWWAVFAAGCTRDQEGLPHHISTEEEIRNMVNDALVPLLKRLPPPVLVTVARSTDDGYCPSNQVDFIQSLILETLKELYDTDVPSLYYLQADT